MQTPRIRLRRSRILAIAFLGICFGGTARAEDPMTIDVTLKNHQFSPSEIHVRAGKPTILKIRNEDATADEFDSSALKIEKIVPAGGSVTVRLRPLGAGRYPFMGEFHPDTAKGFVVAE
jgi:hypothetical protein